MSTTEQYFTLVSTSKSSWVAVPANRSTQPAETASHNRHPDPAPLPSPPASLRLFAHVSTGHLAFFERYPRLTVAFIALVLLAASVTAEIEYLQQSGFRLH